MFTPSVSVVVPVYNGSKYLRRAVDSALSQTYPHVEVIVVNDGSDDNGATEKIARSYGGRIRYFAKQNGGVASALNLGIRRMQADYFSYLSHDDVYYPHKIETQIEWLRRHPDEARRVVLYGDFDLIDQDSQITGTVNSAPVARGAMVRTLSQIYLLSGCTLMVHRDCLTAVGPFNETLWATQDYEMWFRLARRYHFVHIPRPLIQVRRHSQQGSVADPRFAAACNNLYYWAVGFMNKEEVLAGNQNRSLSLAYLDIAYSLAVHSLWRPAWHACRHSLAHLRSERTAGAAAVGIAMLRYGLGKLPAHFISRTLQAVARKLLRR